MHSSPFSNVSGASLALSPSGLSTTNHNTTSSSPSAAAALLNSSSNANGLQPVLNLILNVDLFPDFPSPQQPDSFAASTQLLKYILAQFSVSLRTASSRQSAMRKFVVHGLKVPYLSVPDLPIKKVARAVPLQLADFGPSSRIRSENTLVVDDDAAVWSEEDRDSVIVLNCDYDRVLLLLQRIKGTYEHRITVGGQKKGVDDADVRKILKGETAPRVLPVLDERRRSAVVGSMMPEDTHRDRERNREKEREKEKERESEYLKSATDSEQKGASLLTIEMLAAYASSQEKIWKSSMNPCMYVDYSVGEEAVVNWEAIGRWLCEVRQWDHVRVPIPDTVCAWGDDDGPVSPAAVTMAALFPGRSQSRASSLSSGN
jgi:hypothetical protein